MTKRHQCLAVPKSHGPLRFQRQPDRPTQAFRRGAILLRLENTRLRIKRSMLRAQLCAHHYVTTPFQSPPRRFHAVLESRHRPNSQNNLAPAPTVRPQLRLKPPKSINTTTTCPDKIVHEYDCASTVLLDCSSTNRTASSIVPVRCCGHPFALLYRYNISAPLFPSRSRLATNTFLARLFSTRCENPSWLANSSSNTLCTDL